MRNELNVDQIKKLWLLDLILQSGSLKGAAARAKISPSAVSQSLTLLERSVGKPLVVRDGGSVTATEDALSILEVIRPAFAAFERLNEIGRQPAPQMTWLNFGAYESIAVDILPGLIHTLNEKIPGIRLGIRVNRTAELLTQVRKGGLCSAVVVECDDLERFYRAEVYEDRLGLYASARHFKGFEGVPVGSLAPGKKGLPRFFTRFLKRLGPLKPTVLSESFETLRVATAAGAIVAVLPHRVAMRSADLAEVTPAGRESGAHRIFVIGQVNCDREEADFLAQECRRLLRRPG